MSTSYTPGQAVIDLGAYGKLINPVQVDGGRWYYYWDRSGDGTTANSGALNAGVDYTTHATLDQLFRYSYAEITSTGFSASIRGSSTTTDAIRFTKINGVTVGLPPVGGPSVNPFGPNGLSVGGYGSGNGYQPSTSVGSTASSDGSLADNPMYDGLLAIWDAYNGVGVNETNVSGIPPNWRGYDFWSSTPSGTSPGAGYRVWSSHAFVSFGTGLGGYVYDDTGSEFGYVALEVLPSDDTPPTVTSTAQSGVDSAGTAKTGTLVAGDKVKVVLTMSEATTVSGTPTFSIDLGGVMKTATYASGSGTTSLTFYYTIATGDTDSTGGITAPANALALDGGTLADAAGNSATLTTTAISSGENTIHVDTGAPTIAISSSRQSLKAGETATITFTLSEPSSDFNESDITVSGGSLSGFSGSGLNYTAIFTPDSNSSASGSVSVANAVFSDSAGNLNADGADANNTITLTDDWVTPTIAVSTNKTLLGIGRTATITFTLSESSTDFTASNVTVSGGTLSALSGSGTTYTGIFTPDADSTTPGVVSVASGVFSDAAGNLNADGADSNNIVTMADDWVVPTIAVSSSTLSLKAGETATFTFTLSESVTDFAASDVSVSGGTFSGFSGSGTTYSAIFTPNASSTSPSVVSVASGVFSDAAGNFNADGADSDNTVTMAVDTIRPTIAISSNKPSLKSGESALITFTLSEPSVDFTASDVTVSGGSLSEFKSLGTGTDYTAIFKLTTSNGTGTVSVASNKFSDAAGNFNADGAELNNSVSMPAQMLTGTPRNDYARALATGLDGSIYMAGETEGNLGGQPNAGSRDIFLTKYDTDGSAQWTRLAGTRLIDDAGDLAVSPDGSVLLAGTSQASLMGAGNSGSYDAYLLKYDTAGNLLWSVRQGSTSIDRGYGVASDSTGAAFLIGQTQGRLDGQRSGGNFDGFLTKYDSDGVKLWTRIVGTTGIDVLKDGVTDAQDNVYVVGSVAGTLAGQSRIGGTDAVLAKYASDGTLQWSKLFGTKLTDQAEAVALGSDGSIYVAGQTMGAMNGASSGNYDVFLSKFSNDGTLLWSRQFGSGKADSATDLIVSASGSIHLTGNLGVSSTAGLAGSDAFTATYNASGARTAYEVFGTSSNDYGTAITQGLNSVIYLAGYTNASTLLGRGSNGSYDAYLLPQTNTATLASGTLSAVASDSPDLFQFSSGSYNATITGGFAYGDRLAFPTGYNTFSIINTNPTDGELTVRAANTSQQQIQVTLTGIATADDTAISSIETFWAVFGPPGT